MTKEEFIVKAGKEKVPKIKVGDSIHDVGTIW